MKHTTPDAFLTREVLCCVRDERPASEAFVARFGEQCFHILRKAGAIVLEGQRLRLSLRHLSPDGERFVWGSNSSTWMRTSSTLSGGGRTGRRCITSIPERSPRWWVTCRPRREKVGGHPGRAPDAAPADHGRLRRHDRPPPGDGQQAPLPHRHPGGRHRGRDRRGRVESWEAIAEYGRTKQAFFRRFLRLDNGIPSPDTFERVFAELAPTAFAQAFGRWMASACEATGLVPIAIDGKSSRAATRNTATGCLHMVSAWATEDRLVLGAAAVPDGSNEVAAIPVLLRTLDLAGAIVTIDAAGCQVQNARVIREQEGHYLLSVKDNQPTLRAAVEAVFDRACEADFVGVRSEGHEEVEDGHGRHEERYVTVVYDPPGLPPDWPDVAAVVLVNREREVGGERTVTTHYYITSHDGTAADFGRWVRGHWGIENGLHWVLDVVFREDRSRIRVENAGANLAMIRRVAVSLLRRAPGRGSGVTKRLKAGWDDDYLLQVLQEITESIVR